MNKFQPLATQHSKSLRLLGWVLGLLFILKSLDFFLSINLATESELSPAVLEAILFSVSGVAMLLLTLGTIRVARWVRIPLYVVFVSNAFFIVYSTLLVPNWVDAGISLGGAIVIFLYLKKSKGLTTGRRLLGLQILTILTLLPATIFIVLSVLFPDQPLQDDSTMRLPIAETISDTDNLYVTLTGLGTELPVAVEATDDLVSEYPSTWNQTAANQLVSQLRPHIDAYMTATKQEYQCPTLVNNFAIDTEICELNLLRDYAQIMQFAALTEAERGNTIQAQEYAMAPIEVGLTMIQSENVTMIEYLVGLASLNIGLDTLETLLEENILSEAAVKQQLAGISIPTDSLRTPMQREYLGLRIALDENLDSSQTYLYHPNRTRNELFNFMSQAAEKSIMNCTANDSRSSAEDEKLINYIENVQANAINPSRPNMIGNTFLSVVLASFSGARDNVCEADKRINTLIN